MLTNLKLACYTLAGTPRAVRVPWKDTYIQHKLQTSLSEYVTSHLCRLSLLVPSWGLTRL